MKTLFFIVNSLLILIFIIGTNLAIASSYKPIITLSVGSPYTEKGSCYSGVSYIIKIFESDHVEYNGLREVKVLGNHYHKIDKKALKSLIKKFKDERFMQPERVSSKIEYSRTHLSNCAVAIRFRKNNQEMTKMGTSVLVLMEEIIRLTGATQWGVDDIVYCYHPDK